MSEINLNDWRWLRKVHAIDSNTIDYYTELVRKNEALIVSVFGEDAYNIYLPAKKPNPRTGGKKT